eukprot:3635623-Rhodomonas_salina.1
MSRGSHVRVQRIGSSLNHDEQHDSSSMKLDRRTLCPASHWHGDACLKAETAGVTAGRTRAPGPAGPRRAK